VPLRCCWLAWKVPANVSATFTPTQRPVLETKPGLVGAMDELAKVAESLRDALAAEVQQALDNGADLGRTAALEQAAQELATVRDQHEHQIVQLKAEHAAVVAKAEAEWAAKADAAALLAAEEQGRLAAKEMAAAVAAAKKAALAEALATPMSAEHPLKELLVEPLRDLLHLLYFANVGARLGCMTRRVWLLGVRGTG
jgi:hypothetical protein